MIDTVKLKHYRGRKTQKEVADIAGISQNYYSQIETGERTPALETAVSIATAVGTTINEILLVNPSRPSDSGKRTGALGEVCRSLSKWRSKYFSRGAASEERKGA